MDIIRVNDERLKLILDSGDMKKHGITERALSADNATRRRTLLSVLDEVKQRTGIDAKGRRTLLEAFPDKKGGCEIFVTLLTRNTEGECVSYRFASLSHLSCAIRCLAGERAVGDASLYTLEGGTYVLSLPISAQSPPRSSYAYLSEYGEREEGAYFLPYVREYGTCLCEHDALSYILREKENFSV